jgi:cytochrome P450
VSTGGTEQVQAAGGKLQWGSPEMLEDPFPFYEEARRTTPVCPIRNGEVHLVTRREDIEFLLLNPDLFSVQGRVPIRSFPGQRYPTLPDLTMIDPPAHKALRGAYLTLLSPRRVEAMRPEVAKKAHALIDVFQDEPEIELISALADPLPTWFMGHLLGVDESMHEQLRDWANAYFELLDSARYATVEWEQKASQLKETYVDFMNFCGDLVTEWRADPPDGPIGEFALSRDADGELYPVDVLASQVRLLISGSQTTIHAIAQAVVDAITLGWDKLSDDKYIQRLIEESIRHDGPSTYLPRIPLKDVELSGTKIKAGTKLFISVQSGNRDEDYFERPETLDLERENLRRHIGFGMGIHLCIGAPTARMEATEALKALASRFRRIALSPQNDFKHRIDLTGMRMLKRLQVELEAG